MNVILEIKPPRGKPPEPSKRLPSVNLFIIYLQFVEGIGFAVSFHGYIL